MAAFLRYNGEPHSAAIDRNAKDHHKMHEYLFAPLPLVQVSWWKMFEPFELSLWGAIFVSTVIVVLLLWAFDGDKVRPLMLRVLSHDCTTDGIARQVVACCISRCGWLKSRCWSRKRLYTKVNRT